MRHSPLLMLPFIVLTPMAATLVCLTTGPMQAFWAIFFGLTLIGLFLRLFVGTPGAPLQKDYWQRARMLRSNVNTQYIADILEGLRQLKQLKAECKKNSHHHIMIDLEIIMLEVELNQATSENRPYAPQARLIAAAKVLGLPHNTPLTKHEIANAVTQLEQQYDTKALEARKAPKAVIATAQHRLDEIAAAQRLLENAPKGTML